MTDPTHPFIEAMDKAVLRSYRDNARHALDAIGYTIPDPFTDDDVEDALQRLRSASTGGVKCFYCDAVITPVAAGRADILAHSKVCPEHPCRALEQERDDLRRELARAGGAVPWHNAFHRWGEAEANRLFPDFCHPVTEEKP